MKYELYTPEFCHALTDKGYIVQASIFPAPYEAIGQRNGITYQLSDFSIMPQHKPIEKEVCKDITSTWEWTGSALERGGVTLNVEYSGEIEVMLNGRKYELSNNTTCSDIIGSRFFDKAPTITITPKPGAQIAKATAKVYEY